MTHLTAVDTNIKKLNRITLVLILTFSLYFSSFFPFHGIGIVKGFCQCIANELHVPDSQKSPFTTKRQFGGKRQIALIWLLSLIGSIPSTTIAFIIATTSSTPWLPTRTITPINSARSARWRLYTRLLTAPYQHYEDYFGNFDNST